MTPKGIAEHYCCTEKNTNNYFMIFFVNIYIIVYNIYIYFSV